MVYQSQIKPQISSKRSCRGRLSGGVKNGSILEVYSDSLNNKSDDKKCPSATSTNKSNCSPSFYKVDTSDNELEGDAGLQDSKEEFRNRIIPVSLFASGAQTYSAYADQLQH